ncbi:cytochrome P450 [Zalerion maritima]|uniref:Cytochrome P450 n=1 Tax=Zalerion maritima TaxID=339359 RepID=A0AAD5WTL6_9PEZI|nr:cytochrome P450 [Zalerion maritima]
MTVNGHEYPPAAKMQIPGVSWLASWFTGGSGNTNKKDADRHIVMALLSPITLILLLLAILLAEATRKHRSPLQAVTGPPISSITSLVLKWHEFRADRTGYIHQLHQRYGPVVRIAPNEVAFASPAAVKEIYGSGGSGYDKTEFYDLFTVFGRRTMFTTLNKQDQHARRKRILADRYANANVLRPESVSGITSRARALAQRLVSGDLSYFLARSKHVVRPLLTHLDRCLLYALALHSYAFDCVTNHLFHPHGSHSLERSLDEDVMREVTFDDSLHNRLVQYYCPTFHRLVNKALRLIAKPRETPLADKFVASSCSTTNASRFTLLSRLQDRSGDDIDGVDIKAECLDHMAAGIDTTGDALCFLMWEISQPRSLRFQRMLQDEIRKSPSAPAESLPFLDAVIHEGLRCFPAIPMSLPRYVPQGGRSIDGYFIPGSTIVSCQAYSVHRLDEAAFPMPDEFNPERWLEERGAAKRNRLFFAFSSGGRGCVGKHLALTEMRMALREIYSQFTTVPDPTMTEDMMVMAHQPISSRPKGQICLLRMIPSNEKSS